MDCHDKACGQGKAKGYSGEYTGTFFNDAPHGICRSDLLANLTNISE